MLARTMQGQPDTILIRELITNARRSGARRIEVTVSEASDVTAVEVCDDGQGIEDPCELVNAGQPGWRDPEVARREKPSGCGLLLFAGSGMQVWSGQWTARLGERNLLGDDPVDRMHAASARHGTKVRIEVRGTTRESLTLTAHDCLKYLKGIRAKLNGEPVRLVDFLKDHDKVRSGPWVFGIARGWGGNYDLMCLGRIFQAGLARMENWQGETIRVVARVLRPERLAPLGADQLQLSDDAAAQQLRQASQTALWTWLRDNPEPIPHTMWEEAARNGIEIPIVPGKLMHVNAGRMVQARARTAVLTAETIETRLEITLLNALDEAPEIELVGSEPKYEGYAWYDQLTRIDELLVTMRARHDDTHTQVDFMCAGHVWRSVTVPNRTRKIGRRQTGSRQ